jgi:AraC-like DNA-binding protein
MTGTPIWHRLTSDGLSSKEREALFWDTFNSHVLNFDWTPHDGLLALDAHMAELPGIRMATGRGSAIARRTREAIKDGNDDLVILVNVNSKVWINQRGENIALPPGGAYFGSCTEEFAQAGDLGLGIRLPRATVAHLIHNVDDKVGRFIRPDSAAVKLLIGYVQTLRSSSLSSEDAARLAAPHLHDLIALAVGTDEERTRLLSRRGFGAAQLLALQKDIEGLIGEGEVSAEQLGRRHGLTSRYIRMLFEREGTSLGQYVLERRLHHAALALADPGQDHRRISDIAYDVGFGDLSYFNRTFRRFLHCTPSDVRAANEAFRSGSRSSSSNPSAPTNGRFMDWRTGS